MLLLYKIAKIKIISTIDIYFNCTHLYITFYKIEKYVY